MSVPVTVSDVFGGKKWPFVPVRWTLGEDSNEPRVSCGFWAVASGMFSRVDSHHSVVDDNPSNRVMFSVQLSDGPSRSKTKDQLRASDLRR